MRLIEPKIRDFYERSDELVEVSSLPDWYRPMLEKLSEFGTWEEDVFIMNGILVRWNGMYDSPVYTPI